MSTEIATKTGSCLCGNVRYEVTGPLRDVIACHCNQCRKSTGHFVSATSAELVQFRIVSDDTLTWYRASDFASRGFCGRCGSNLFWQRDDADRISIMAGTIDGPTGLTTAAHIFCKSAGDYYRIDDSVPNHARAGHGVTVPK